VVTHRVEEISASESAESDSRIRALSQLWAPPEEFDDYVVLRPLGHGSMGHVYLAEDRVLARLVAVKFIAALEPNVEARQRFLIEARAAARVQHPNVVTIYRVGEIEGRPYLITEFARGRTLDRLSRPVPTAEALQIAIDLARGLAAAHRKGVLHCDIKSANAILTDEGSAKLLDFGLATLLKVVPASEVASAAESPSVEDPTATPLEVADGHRGRVVGTPDTMAPEIWGGTAPTRRSDVYSLGAVLYELCSGVTPFHDAAPEDLARVVRASDAPGLITRAPRFDPRFAEIIDRCLRRAPSARFASGDDLRQALEQLARTVAGAAIPEGNPYRGLRAFDVQHRALFFGRSAEISVLVDRLRAESFLVVAGDSGAGKSSICRAGVLPIVTEGGLGGARVWSTCTWVPGKRPRAALAAALAERFGVTAELVTGWIDRDGRVLAHEIGSRLAGPASGLLIFLDQAEELCTLSDRDEAEIVDAALGALVAQLPGVRVLATVRADFLARFASLPALGEGLAQALYFLRPLPPERVREVIVGPAQATHVRFESEAMVETLVEATARAEGGLPLLQFALAELWEARDVSTGVIREAALAIMGGVAGALSRHGDAVLAAMRSPLRVEARRMLLRLVTLDNTRIRRSEAELRADVEPARSALDALVRARILVAQDGEDGGAYELAHEVLVQGWTTLRRWLVEDAESREVRERLAGAAAEWRRLHRAPEALWRAPQLAEVARIAPADLTEGEGAFLAASGRATKRRKWLGRAAIAAVPMLIALGYGAVAMTQGRARSLAVAQLMRESAASIEAARLAHAEAEAEAATAFRLFDAQDPKKGELAWARAREHEAASARGLRTATQNLENAYAKDPERADVSRALGEVLFTRALRAEKAAKLDERDEYVDRFRLHDVGAALATRWKQPGYLAVASDPPGATASLLRYGPVPGAGLALVPIRELGATPIADVTLENGSYLVELVAPGRPLVRYPVVVDRGEHVSIRAALPAAAEVPAGFVYVPEGRFQFGSADESARAGFFDTVPIHEVRLGAYLIQRTEVTYASWLEYLRALGPAERTERTPSAAAKLGVSGALQLTEEGDGTWRLTLQPSERVSTAREGEQLRYEGRTHRAQQDWRLLPVSGVSALDAMAYAAWLDATKLAPGARLCTELEWEKAARGADGREFPHGDHLDVDDANFDSTYDREAMGPDEVGSHPVSRSPFGVEDMSGNIFEWTTSSVVAGKTVVRGGSYYHDAKTLRIPNRNTSPANVRDTNVGLRLCASLARR
jgi:formylglycine-generating enzyme required for sulfatase activity